MKYSRRRRDSFQDESFVGRYITGPLSHFTERISNRFKRAEGDIGQRRWSERTFALPARIFSALIISPTIFLVTGWASSRQALPFLLGLPAVLTALFAVAPGLAFINLKDKVRKSYDGLSARAITTNNTDLAEMATQKLFALEPGNRDYYFRLASTIGEKKKDPNYARQLIEQLAIGPEIQNINGHLWVAQHLITKSETMADEDVAEAEAHLQKALAANPDHYTANKLAFDLYTKANRPETALEYARIVAKAEPLSSHLLLKLQKDLGRTEEFEQTLTSVLLVISEVAYRNPTDIDLWKELVTCSLQGDRYQEAISFVQTGLALTGDQNTRIQLSMLASVVLVSWHDKLMSFTDKARLQQAVRVLNWALHVSPGNSEALLRASELYLNPSLDSTRIDWIMETLASDENAYCTHLMIGWRSLFIDKEAGVSAARVHWQVAATSSKMFPIVLSQLSAGIATLEPEKRPFVLEALELAMSVAPDKPAIGETRGFVLMKAERWFEARQQLEEVLPTSERQYLVLTSLVKCCEMLDDKVKREIYRAELERLPRPVVN